LQQVTCSLALPLYWPRVNRPLGKEKILAIERGALDRTLWRTRSEEDYGPVIRQGT